MPSKPGKWAILCTGIDTTAENSTDKCWYFGISDSDSLEMKLVHPKPLCAMIPLKTSYIQLNDIFKVASILPFDLNDSDEINSVYRKWRQTHEETELKHLEIWTYCFVRRYFIRKFMSRTSTDSADLELIIDRCLQKIRNHRIGIHTPERYANWVSVVCKNTFLNAIRNPQKTVEIEEIAYHTDENITGRFCEETSTYTTVESAIDELPQFLQEVAKLRLLKGWSYDEISLQTGRGVPIIRSYTHKAVKRLRIHPAVAELREAS